MFGTNNICVLHTWRGIVIIQAGAVYLLLPGWLGARSRYFILRKPEPGQNVRTQGTAGDQIGAISKTFGAKSRS